MAVGMFCNLWPHLTQAAILQVQDNHNCMHGCIIMVSPCMFLDVLVQFPTYQKKKKKKSSTQIKGKMSSTPV